MNKKKLGIAYNLYDGEELLEASLTNMRSMVDFICVVYQTKSNFNQKNKNVEKEVLRLQEKGLIDKIYKYEPFFQYHKNGELDAGNGLKNEVKKRNIGLQICKYNDCEIFMTIDCDEFYDKEDFIKSKELFIKFDYDSSYCQMRTYYKNPTLELVPPETYYVPLFYKIDNREFDLANRTIHYPVLADPTRCLQAKNTYIFNRVEIEMHHYSYVRKSLDSKIMNSSSQRSRLHQMNVIEYFNNFKNEYTKALLLGDEKLVELKKVKNRFNIKI